MFVHYVLFISPFSSLFSNPLRYLEVKMHDTSLPACIAKFQGVLNCFHRVSASTFLFTLKQLLSQARFGKISDYSHTETQSLGLLLQLNRH